MWDLMKTQRKNNNGKRVGSNVRLQTILKKASHGAYGELYAGAIGDENEYRKLEVVVGQTAVRIRSTNAQDELHFDTCIVVAVNDLADDDTGIVELVLDLQPAHGTGTFRIESADSLVLRADLHLVPSLSMNKHWQIVHASTGMDVQEDPTNMSIFPNVPLPLDDGEDE
eukprot:gene26687-32781_t